MPNKLEEWKQDADMLTPEKVLEEDIKRERIRKELNQFSESKKVSFLLQTLGRDADHSRDNSTEELLTQAVCRVVTLKRANQHYKKRIDKLQEKLDQRSEA